MRIAHMAAYVCMSLRLDDVLAQIAAYFLFGVFCPYCCILLLTCAYCCVWVHVVVAYGLRQLKVAAWLCIYRCIQLHIVHVAANCYKWPLVITYEGILLHFLVHCCIWLHMAGYNCILLHFVACCQTSFA